jgi:hypothetical protein
MTKLVIENDTPFRLTPSSRPQVGSSWYDLPEVTAVLAIPQPAWAAISFSPAIPPGYQIATGPAVKYLSPLDNRFWLLEGLAPYSLSDGLGMTWEGTDNQMLLPGQGLELSVFAGGPWAAQARQAADKAQYFTDNLTPMYPDYAGYATLRARSSTGRPSSGPAAATHAPPPAR